MGVLKPTLLAFLAGCYSPTVRDCSVTCARASDCAEHQVCGDDHFCSSPERAGTCVQSPVDAPLAIAPDAPPPDAAPPDATPDASPYGTVHMLVSGGGTIVLDSATSCRNDCTWIVPLGAHVDLQAFPDRDKQLSAWTGPCTGNDATCSFVLVSSVTVSAKFVKASE
jgi:hypothetical protein